ncbi:hypothetical protein BGX26_010689 [Mortierella sp. AD094]|nr:hypothetical protein BGX26_010689 [Mortierella sp. AD094]
MMSMIRIATPKAIVSRRLISSSAKSNAVAASIGHNIMPSTASPSSSSRTAKTAGYAILGSTVVATGVSLLLKDEVVYWTPNARNHGMKNLLLAKSGGFLRKGSAVKESASMRRSQSPSFEGVRVYERRRNTKHLRTHC